MKRGTPEHPKTVRLAKLLHIQRWGAVGILESLWHFTSRFAIQGDIGAWTDQEIAEAIGWTGDPGRLITALVEAGWLDRNQAYRLVVHDWHDHAQESVRKTLRNRSLLFVTFRENSRKVEKIPETVGPSLSLSLSHSLSPAAPLPEPEPKPKAKTSAIAENAMAGNEAEKPSEARGNREPIARSNQSQEPPGTHQDAPGTTISEERPQETPGRQPIPRRKPNVLWDAVVELWGLVSAGQETRIGKIVAVLKLKEATPQELTIRKLRYESHWPEADCTPEAMVKHWDMFAQDLPPPGTQTTQRQLADVFSKINEERKKERWP
jgi:hypothetical protein